MMVNKVSKMSDFLMVQEAQKLTKQLIQRRDITMKKVLMSLSAVMICLCLISCGSNPKKIGEQLGREYCDCKKEHDSVYRDFLAKFDSYGFKTRIEARKKLQDLQNEAEKKFEENKTRFEQKVKELQAKFPTDIYDISDPKIQKKYRENPQKFSVEFENNREKAKAIAGAIRSITSQCDAPDKEKEQDYSKISAKILTIIPPRPDAENLKQNLVKRRLIEQPGGYYGQGWGIQIASADEIKSIKIENGEKIGDDYVFDVHLLIQKEVNQYDADLKITSVLRQSDDWQIDFIETRDVHIVKTGRYDNCVSAKINNSRQTYLQFTNNCDVTLVVGGRMQGNDDEWIKFLTRVNANGAGSASYSGKEYKIDFIERQ